MNTGAFGEGFPYTNFHDLNMDWIIKIAKDFLDQYTNIQNTISDGLTALDEKTQQGLADLDEKAEALETALQNWYDEHSADIADELTSAIADFRTTAQEIATEVIATIPQDYTALSNAVTELQNKCIQSANTVINDSSLTTVIASGDLDDLYSNQRVYYCSGLTSASHQPISTMSGILMIIKYSSSRDTGVMQLFYSYDGIVAYRMNHGNSDNWTWYDWCIYNPNSTLHTSQQVLNNSNISERVPSGDFDNLYAEQITYYCSSLTDGLHQPVDTMNGLFMVLKFSYSYPSGTMQLYWGRNGTVCYRINHGNTEDWQWEDWFEFSNINSVTSSGIIIRNTNYTTYMENGNLDNLYDPQKIYYIAGLSLATNQPVPTMNGMFFIYQYKPDVEIGIMQVYYDNKGEVYYRISHGTGLSWDKWNNIGNKLNRYTCKIFKKVVCCGDSYTSAYIVDTNDTVHRENEEFAYPHYMATLTGNEWVNCGASGTNAQTWQSSDRGLYKAQLSGKTQAYILALMINDASTDPDRHLDVGTAEDIGTNTSTYYAQYSKIIRELATISPNAFIFLCTIPDTSSQYTDYIDAVKVIYNAYKNTYNVHLLDLYRYRVLYEMASLTGDKRSGHYTAIGYEQFAEIMSYVLSDYINTHVADFIDTAFIEYKYEDNREAVETVIANNTPTALTFTNTYISAKGNYVTISGKTYFSIMINMLSNVNSGVNNILTGLPAPTNGHVMFDERDMAMQKNGRYLSYTTGWRLNGKHTTGDNLFYWGVYDS